MVNMVHSGAIQSVHMDYHELYRQDNLNQFPVRWTDGIFPTAAANCSQSVDCTLLPETATCVCSTTVIDTAVFTDLEELPSRAEVLQRLHVGASPPQSFDSGTYTRCETAACDNADYIVWVKRNSTVDAVDTIFLLDRLAGLPVWLLNKESMVSFSGFSFHNPPSFMKAHTVSSHDAFHETEAVIDSMLTHDNVPPFIAKALLQRFTTSNPSPRYHETVATAFATGAYGGRTCSGTYGDMGAAIAAVLLDREARSTTVAADTTHGLLRSPLDQYIHVLRSMEVEPRVKIQLEGRKIGMAPMYAQSVFVRRPTNPSFELCMTS